MVVVLYGISNKYKFTVYENNRDDISVDLTISITSDFTIDGKLCTTLSNIKKNILRYYNKQFKWKHPIMNTTEIAMFKYNGIAKYNIKIKEIKNG